MSEENIALTLSAAKASIKKTTAYKTLDSFFDQGTFTQIDAYAQSQDNYAEAVAGYGTVNSCPTFAFAQNSDICGGAMSNAQAAKLKKVYDLAIKTGTPVVGFYDSVGAKLTQGLDVLSSYGNVLNSVSNLSGVVPQISVILGTCLGTGALNAVSADIVIMSEKAQLSLDVTGKNSSAEDVKKAGISHLTVKDTADAIAKAQQVITMLPSNNLSVSPLTDADEPKPQGKCPISAIVDADSYISLKSGYGEQVSTGLARLVGSVVGVIATKGADLDADSCEKMAKFVRFCDAFAIPVVTLADSTGFADVAQAAKVTSAYAEATTVKATVITGQAYGAFYIAVAGTGANADITMAWDNSVISLLPPITGAALMWQDKMEVSHDKRNAVVEEYKKQECTALKAAAKGYVEDVIAADDTRIKLYSAITMLAGKRVSSLPKKHGTV